MKALFIPLLTLLSTPLLAQSQPPVVIGYMPNTEGGRIAFTSRQNGCPDRQLFAYIISKTGRVITNGCYFPVGDDLTVIWNDDKSVFSYPMDYLAFTDEFKAYTQSR